MQYREELFIAAELAAFQPLTIRDYDEWARLYEWLRTRTDECDLALRMPLKFSEAWEEWRKANGKVP